MKIADLKKIISEVLATLPKPHSADVIDEVFLAIEQNDRLFRIYSECCISLGRAKVNTAGDNWVRKELGGTVLRESPAQLSKLIDTYSVLNTQAVEVRRKPTGTAAKPKARTATAKKRREQEARQLMSDYYTANRASLPQNITLYRAQILALIGAGVPVAEAFMQPLAKEAD